MQRELGAALLLVAALLGVAERPPESVEAADAPHHEGDHVRLTGWAQDVRRGDDWFRFDLMQDDHALPVRGDHSESIPGDRPIEVTGRLQRESGRLTLVAEHVRWTS